MRVLIPLPTYTSGCLRVVLVVSLIANELVHLLFAFLLMVPPPRSMTACVELDDAAAAADELCSLRSSSDGTEIALPGELLFVNLYCCVDACGFEY